MQKKIEITPYTLSDHYIKVQNQQLQKQENLQTHEKWTTLFWIKVGQDRNKEKLDFLELN